MKISIDIDEMIKKANALENIAAELQTNMQSIEKLILDLGYEWQGNAELAYTAKILYIKKQFYALHDLINEYSLFLKAVANDYKEVETAIKNQLEV